MSHSRSGAIVLRSALLRGVGFLCVWITLIGGGPADLVAGLAAGAAAAWASLRLIPPGAARVRPAALLGLVPRFLWQSVVAGVDVARRALDPRMPLRPGFVRYTPRFEPGLARNAFATLTSLLPGTVPAEDDGEALLYHCLDVEQPVAAQLSAEELRLSRAFPGARAHD
jgi:multicomponent Na+:H+ antiporter subunit E